MSRRRIEFGDFQTPMQLSNLVTSLLKELSINPHIIIEPTCGSGSFLISGMESFNDAKHFYGFDINKEYIQELSLKFKDCKNIEIIEQDFFSFNWSGFVQSFKNPILCIGNPPWVTNAVLGTISSKNLPEKSNFQGLSGFSAKTGKSNFDISEWILIKLSEALNKSDSYIAMLCKTSTARKVLLYNWRNNIEVDDSKLFLFDSKKYFNISAGACLLYMSFKPNHFEKKADIYSDLNLQNRIATMGIINNELVADIDSYKRASAIDGLQYYTWRSGIKHDAAKVMELERVDNTYRNGFGEIIDLEDTYVYPLLKSSDLGNNRLKPRKYVIVTQKNMKEPTNTINKKAPKTWDYLNRYSNILLNRKSSIYNNRPQFCIFGIGDYAFSHWKVAISGLYKNIHFNAIGPYESKPIMLDDTCYFISCKNEKEAVFISQLLNSQISIDFIHSLVFFDAKRPVTIDVLKRIDLRKLATKLGVGKKDTNCLKQSKYISNGQMCLVFGKNDRITSNSECVASI